LGENCSSLEYGNCRVSANAPMPMQCFVDVKVNFERKKSVLPRENDFSLGSSHCEISLSCSSQEYDVTAPYYLIFALLSVKWSLMGGLKQKKISNF